MFSSRMLAHPARWIKSLDRIRHRRSREENAQVTTILPGKNFPYAGKSKSIRKPTS
jgi:hypothetical protein